MPAGPFQNGVKAALDHFGLGPLRRGMPNGPAHLGAERLARRLQQEEEHNLTGRPSKQNRLERPTRWGDPMPMDSGSMTYQGHSGIGEYAGA